MKKFFEKIKKEYFEEIQKEFEINKKLRSSFKQLCIAIGLFDVCVVNLAIAIKDLTSKIILFGGSIFLIIVVIFLGTMIVEERNMRYKSNQ